MKSRSHVLKKILALTVALVSILSAFTGYVGNTENSTSSGTAGSVAASEAKSTAASVSIANISYDPTRELYKQYNQLFQRYQEKEKSQKVEITQSHDGSGKQACSMLEGDEADMVTLALEGDVSELQKADLIDEDWANKLPKGSAPYTSTVVFLVRKGNPKNIRDWDDVIKPGVEMITPDPKSSGGTRWNSLVTWAYADKRFAGDETKDKEFLKSLYSNVIILDPGARGSTTAFVENGQGDVLLAWENEAYLSLKEHPDTFEIVTPSLSILAQPPVAVVGANVEKYKIKEVSEAYLEYLYFDEAQRLEDQNYYRPSDPDILKDFSDTFDLDVTLVSIDDDFGGWDKVTERFFADDATFDQIHKR